MDSENRKELLKKLEQGYRFPTLAPLAVQLMSLAVSDKSSAADLEKVIEKDPAMTTRIINLANGVFFRTAYPVTTLRRAIVQIGFEQVRLMALSISFRDTFPYGKVDGMDYVLFWKNALYRALLARSLAASVDECNPEEAFVAGLTLEIGVLIFHDLFFKKQKIEVPQDNLFTLLELEEKTVGVNHREVGDVTLRYLGFPDKYVQCQLLYGDNLKEKDVDPLILVVNAAMELSSFMFSKTAGLVPPIRQIKQLTDLSPEQLYNIVTDTFRIVDDIAKSLELAADSARDVLIVIEKAQSLIQKVKIKFEKNKEVLDDKATLSRLTASQKISFEKDIQAFLIKLTKIIQFVRPFIQKLSVTFEPFSNAEKLSVNLLSQIVILDVEIEKFQMSYREALQV
jgi:HD-like signal output (HDOD) protein